MTSVDPSRHIEDPSTEHEPAPPDDGADHRGDEINLLDLFLILARHKAIIIALPVIAAIAAAIYALTLPNVYTAGAKILPPQTQSASSGLLSQLGGLSALAGGAGLKSPTDIYVAMLKSRTVADNLVSRFKLAEASADKRPSIVRSDLAKRTMIMPNKDGTITVEVTDADPKLAAELANAYVDELYKLTNVLALTEASQRRLFFERQFAQAKENLANAETAARQSLEKGGIVAVEGQGRAMTEVVGRLRGQITVKEVQIAAMRTFATAQHPELLAAQKELDAMRVELARLEGATDGGAVEQKRGSTRGMDSVRMLRNVKYYETVYELLAKQYEVAKLDEAKDSGVVQVLDPAVVPDLRSGPKRAHIVVLWTVAAFVLAILYAFLREVLLRARNDPRQAARLDILRRQLSWR